MVDESSASADRVLTAARDFSARRADLWRDVHVEHLEVHDSGEAWADVTEGNPWPIGVVWERVHYDWSQPTACDETRHAPAQAVAHRWHSDSEKVPISRAV